VVKRGRGIKKKWGGKTFRQNSLRTKYKYPYNEFQLKARCSNAGRPSSRRGRVTVGEAREMEQCTQKNLDGMGCEAKGKGCMIEEEKL